MARSALCPRLAALSNCESYDGRRPFPGCVGLELQHIGAGSDAFKACSTQRGSDRRQNHGSTRTRITFLSYSVSSAWVISLPSWAYTRPPLLRHALRAFWHGPISVWRRQRAATFSSSSIVAIVRSFPTDGTNENGTGRNRSGVELVGDGQPIHRGYDAQAHYHH